MSSAVQDRLPVSESPWQQARKRFMQTRMGPTGLAILSSVFLFVVIGSLLLPYDFYNVPQPDVINFVGRPPAWGRPFGETGMLQLDVMTLVANGGWSSLIIGFATAIGSITIGTTVGAIAGFFGGKIDSFLMRLADVFLMIPSLFVILFLARVFQGEGGGGIWSLVIVFIAFGWILPNAIGPVVVSAPFIVGGAIVGEAFISYLGFGVNPATPTWGNILSESSKFLQQGNWWWIGFPGLFIVLTSLSVNMIGDTLRSALDPRGRK